MCGRWYTSDFNVVVTDIKHLSLRGSKACILAYKESAPRVCSHQVTACFTSASVANCLPASYFVRRPKNWKSLYPILPSGFVTCSSYFWKLVGHLPSIPDLTPADFSKQIRNKRISNKSLKRVAAEPFRSAYLRFLCT
jgi:hypothetical protein